MLRSTLQITEINRPLLSTLSNQFASPTSKCRSRRKGRYAPPVHMIKVTATRETYRWVHPDEE